MFKRRRTIVPRSDGSKSDAYYPYAHARSRIVRIPFGILTEPFWKVSPDHWRKYHPTRRFGEDGEMGPEVHRSRRCCCSFPRSTDYAELAKGINRLHTTQRTQHYRGRGFDYCYRYSIQINLSLPDELMYLLLACRQ
jgi:hypothetical protein